MPVLVTLACFCIQTLRWCSLHLTSSADALPPCAAPSAVGLTVQSCMQRFSQSNMVHQTVFEMIAAEILTMIPQTPGMGTPDGSVHKGTQTAAKKEPHLYVTRVTAA